MFQIGELAKRCGVTADTLRFYEKNGLIKPAGRSESGYRLYNEENQKQVRFILKAKELGLSLDEIKDLLEIKLEATEHSCAEVKAITSAKLELIDEKINELTKIRRALKKINDACCGHVNDDASHCSILAALEQSGFLSCPRWSLDEMVYQEPAALRPIIPPLYLLKEMVPRHF